MKRKVASFCLLSVLWGCGEEAPPHTVTEFMEDPILLEATMVRCAQDRAASRYEPECVNASEAVNRIAAARERGRREELEAESERKRQALRRAQQAAADVRRRAQEAQKRQEETDYFGEFDSLPPDHEPLRDEAPATGDGAESAGIGSADTESAPEAHPPGNPQPTPGAASLAERGTGVTESDTNVSTEAGAEEPAAYPTPAVEN